MERLPKSEVKRFYSARKTIRSQDDVWSNHSYAKIDRFLREIPEESYSGFGLNAGSANVGFGVHTVADGVISLDIVYKLLPEEGLRVVGDVENLPFPECEFDFILSVGAVLNYVDAAVTLAEFRRVLKGGGFLILQFETTESLEFLGTEIFGRSAQIVWTEYDGERHRQWVYSRHYILDILRANDFSIIKKAHYHIASPILLRSRWLNLNVRYMASLDRWLNGTPLARLSESVIILAKKA
jgi:SAM-dependent methyltransferase